MNTHSMTMTGALTLLFAAGCGDSGATNTSATGTTGGTTGAPATGSTGDVATTGSTSDVAPTGSTGDVATTGSSSDSVTGSATSDSGDAPECTLPVTANTWVDWIDLAAPGTVRLPSGFAGRYEFRGWNNITSDGQRSYLYEGYRDDEVGGYRGYSIYANGVYALDLPMRQAELLAVSNWEKHDVTNPETSTTCNITFPSLDTLDTPTPVDRHPYGAFHVSYDGAQALLMFGANASVHFSRKPEDWCFPSSSPTDVWSLDMSSQQWNLLVRDPRCTWCAPDASPTVPVPGSTGGTKVVSFPDEAAFYAVVTHTSSGSTYVMRYDRTTSEWSMLGELSDSPGGLSAISIAADTRRRRLLVEMVVPQLGHEPGFYVFDVLSRSWQRLPAGGDVEPRSEPGEDRWVAAAYDARRDLYFVNGADGLHTYDPNQATWQRVSDAPFPYHSNLVGFTYDHRCDVLLARTTDAGQQQHIMVYSHRP